MSQTDFTEEELAEIDRLEAEIVTLTDQMRQREQGARDLMEEECVEQGRTFAKEIFELRQDKLRLETEIMMRRNKINRIRLGVAVM
ncbi:MAG: hypothetical protein HQK81_04555 [Desulfovibrionaceae bacterium]|nr:hypothetical protein [Desulfovibrionaceae bacterium]MBF0513316.1 hypothetical protein [Desulfovibrionaceae bacterium]